MRAALPVDLSSFIGRQRELETVHDLLGSTRLITLTGAGGSGKTRLALEVSHRVVAGGRDVAWADLAAVVEEALLVRQVSEAFGMKEELAGDGVDGLVDLLRARTALLVLDNCEHLIEACADLVEAVLHGCPEIRILATSREALGVRGERAWLVPPLATPSPEHQDPASCEAVRLFVERARDAAPAFRLNPDNIRAVSEICRRLDGIPLAIELAAARVAVLSPAQIQQRLDNVFSLLSSGRRTVIPRHRTLRAAIDWSHDLLRPEGKVLFRRLAVFRGGFTLDAVEAVASGDGIEAGDVLDGIARLAERSLIGVREHLDTARYYLLETVRQYAAERLEESGEADTIRTRLARHVTTLVTEAEPHLTGLDRPAWVERLHADVDNIREVLHWSREHDPHLHIRLCGMLWWFWYSAASWNEARRWLADALNLPEATGDTRDRAALLFASGALASLQARADDARARLVESARVAAAIGDHRLEAYALNYVAMTWTQVGKPDGRAPAEKAATWFRENRDFYGLRLAELLLGFTAMSEGDMAGAIRHAEQAVAIARAHALDRELSVAVHCLGAMLLRTGDLDRAEALLEEALAASQRDPSYLFIARTLEHLAIIFAQRGERARAVRVFGSAHAVRELIGARRFSMDNPHVEKVVDDLRAAMAEAEFERCTEAGRRLSVDAAIDEILQAAAPAAAQAAPSPAAAGVAPEPLRGVEPVAAAVVPDPPPPAAALANGGSAGTAAVHVPADESADLWVYALGPFRVVSGDAPWHERTWTYSKPKELLVYLLLHPAGRTRDQIASAIWPGATPAQLRNSFHVTVHHLRKALGGTHWVVLRDDRYMLDPAAKVRFDAADFTAAARAALALPAGTDAEQPLREALRLYRGDLLDDEVAAPWHEEPRSDLCRLQVEVSLRLGQVLDDAGRHAEALEIYSRVVARDDLNEEAHRRLMAAWARTGDRVRAIRHYERLVSLLQDVIESEPEAETVDLVDRIRSAVV